MLISKIRSGYAMRAAKEAMNIARDFTNFISEWMLL
jgi:hypothetical protein